MSKQLTVTVNLTNDTFADGFGDIELAAVLRGAASRIASGGLNLGAHVLAPETGFPLQDTNGNSIGRVFVEA